MSYLEQVSRAGDRDFQARLGQAVRKAALDIAAEDPNTANHAARKALSGRVLSGQVGVEAWALAVLADDTTSALSADTVIFNRVASIWNAMSNTGA